MEELSNHCKALIADTMATLGTELLSHFPQDHPIITAYCDFSSQVKSLLITPEEEAEIEEKWGTFVKEIQKRLNAPNN